jgi:UDP-3-O-[3-hydroxymyristoyl] glucosamine N-acyltransferase
MKIGQIKIGNRVTIGSDSTVLYGAYLDDSVQLRPLTVVMKEEYIPPNTEWNGAPAVPHGIAVEPPSMLCSDIRRTTSARRTLVRNPAILLFDETTSALDSRN